jgi:dihydrofolate reductase
MPITLIAALANNRCIGKDGAVPWRLPEDMKRFKDLTMGHVVVMGRKTWESLPEKFRPLPGRKNVVLTRQSDYALPKDVERFGTLQDALAAHADHNIFIIGGAEIYAQALPLADRLELTLVHHEVEGDAFFPDYQNGVWKEVARADHSEYSFVTYERSQKNI